MNPHRSQYLIYALILLSMTQYRSSWAQGICSGNLGENIFTQGDFGSGVAPVLSIDPNIAPGYSYTTAVPPDGSYTICNNTAALAGLYPTWLRTRDNSPDDNGYMMVVNASFSPGLFYRETVDGLCENTLYEFSADILNMIAIGVENHIDPDVTFLIDGQVVYSTGTIPKTEQWAKYGFSFETNATQSSIELSLRNNAPGGTGNDLALDNISFRPCGPASFIGLENEDTNIFLCKDDDPLTVVADILGSNGVTYAIQWQESTDGVIWTDMQGKTSATITHEIFDPGLYYYRYYSAANEINIQNEKCRIISDVITITILPDTYTAVDSLCEGSTYAFGDQALTTSGTYVEGFQSSFGCDSIVSLDLAIVPELTIDIAFTAEAPSCFGFEDGSIIVDNVTGGYGDLTHILYDNNGNEVDGELASGSYEIVATDRFGCEERTMVTLLEPAEVFVHLPPDTSLRLGAELEITPEYASTVDAIFWSVDGDLDCAECATVLVLPFGTQLATVTVIDKNDCIDVDTMMITVSADGLVTLPNIFSPNEDRINDGFTINYFGRSVATVDRFYVYDRWGGLVHALENVVLPSGSVIWDGYSDESPVSEGMYSYLLRVTYVNGTIEDVVGSMTIVR